MQIIVNGQRRECAPASIAELWRHEMAEQTPDQDAQGNGAAEPRGYAIALNGEIVRRNSWATTPVADGDRIEIVRAMQGG